MEKIKVCEFEVDGKVDAELFLKVKEASEEEEGEMVIPKECGVCYAEDSFEVVDGKWRCKECNSEYGGGFAYEEE